MSLMDKDAEAEIAKKAGNEAVHKARIKEVTSKLDKLRQYTRPDGILSGYLSYYRKIHKTKLQALADIIDAAHSELEELLKSYMDEERKLMDEDLKRRGRR